MKRILAGLGIMLAPLAMVWAQDGASLYETNCAGCHGARMEGGSATALIKTDWKYATNSGLLTRVITYGISGTEMAGWHARLSEEEIQAVASYIETAQTQPLAARKPLPSSLSTEQYTLEIKKIVGEGLESPWSIAFIDEHRAFVTELQGGIRLLVDGSLDPNPVRGVPRPLENNYGGFMGIALDPDYGANGWVYLAIAHTPYDPGDAGAAAMTSVVRGRIREHTWADEEVLFRVPQALNVAGGNRWGGRLLFGSDGYLYFSIGDMAEGPASQDLRRAIGKTYRIHPDGSIPNDNPYVDEPGALGAIFTIGNRNTQGLAEHPVTGEIWSTDHGPMGGDELNILRSGGNYGWPEVTYGLDYDGSTVSTETEAEGMTRPVIYWTPSPAVCPAEFVNSSLFPRWENNLLIGALAFEELRRIVIENDRVTHEETILKGFGRVRDVKTSPDGSIYVLLNRPDMIIRLRPQ